MSNVFYEYKLSKLGLTMGFCLMSKYTKITYNIDQKHLTIVNRYIHLFLIRYF